MDPDVVIQVEHLKMAFGDFVIQEDMNFSVHKGDIFVVMGGSGCGKSTLLMHLIGLHAPAKGAIHYGRESLYGEAAGARDRIMRRIGVLFQSGALISSLTLAENVALPLGAFTALSPRQMAEVVSYKLALVGLKGFEDYYPSEISGGMQKRAGLARAIAMDPEILFFDEPSAGLDPISAKMLDDLIESLRNSLGATIVLVTHELPSIFAIGTNSIFLDPKTRRIIAQGPPQEILKTTDNPEVVRFLTRDNPARRGVVNGVSS